MNIEKGELLQGTLYEMFLKSRAREQIEAYCRRSGEDLDDVSAKFMANLLDQFPAKLLIPDYMDIDGGFTWDMTPERQHYWYNINDH